MIYIYTCKRRPAWLTHMIFIYPSPSWTGRRLQRHYLQLEQLMNHLWLGYRCNPTTIEIRHYYDIYIKKFQKLTYFLYVKSHEMFFFFLHGQKKENLRKMPCARWNEIMTKLDNGNWMKTKKNILAKYWKKNECMIGVKKKKKSEIL